MIRRVVNCGFNSCSLGDLKGSHCSVWQILKKKITNYWVLKATHVISMQLRSWNLIIWPHLWPFIQGWLTARDGLCKFLQSHHPASSLEEVRLFHLSKQTGKIWGVGIRWNLRDMCVILYEHIGSYMLTSTHSALVWPRKQVSVWLGTSIHLLFEKQALSSPSAGLPRDFGWLAGFPFHRPLPQQQGSSPALKPEWGDIIF